MFIVLIRNDHGSEFENKNVQAFWEKHDINHKFSTSIILKPKCCGEKK